MRRKRSVLPGPPLSEETGFDVELAVVEVAFDYTAIDEAFRQRAGAMGAGVVGDVKLAAFPGRFFDGQLRLFLGADK